MFLLVLIIFFNTMMFSVVLNERFNKKIGLIIQGLAFIISLISMGVLSSVISDRVILTSSVSTSNAVILLIASIFYSNNNIAQKLTLAFVSHFNYLLSLSFATIIMGFSLVNFAGVSSIVTGNLIFIIITLLTTALLKGPFHYLSKKGISITECLITLIAYTSCIFVSGVFFETIGVTSEPLKLLSGITLSNIVILIYRANYSAAKSKIQELSRYIERKYSLLSANTLNGLKTNLDEYKSLNQNVDKHLSKMLFIADKEKNTEIYNYIRLNRDDMLKTPFNNILSDNQYINTVLSVKNAQAKMLDMDLNFSLNLDECKLKTLDLCNVLDSVLNVAIDEVKSSNTEDRKIDLSANSKLNNIELNASFVSAINNQHTNIFTKATLYEILEDLIKDTKEPELKNFDFLTELVNRLNGKIEINIEDDRIYLKIIINY